MADGESSTLPRSAIFEEISDETIEGLCSRGRAVQFEANDTLFERGDQADYLMILRQGVVDLLIPVRILGVTREVTLERKHSGDIVAWSALISPYQYTLNARCASASTLFQLDREALLAFFAADPQTGQLFMRNLAGVIGRRFQAMQMIWVQSLQANAARGLE